MRRMDVLANPSDRLIVVGLVIVAAALRCVRLGGESLWIDELMSAWFIRLSFGDLWLHIRHVEPSPPLYYMLLKAWSVFGSSEAAMRSLSVIGSVLCVPFIYSLGRALAPGTDGRWCGALASLLFIVHPLHVRYAQEARQYALLSLAFIALLWGMACFACWPGLLRVPWRSIARRDDDIACQGGPRPLAAMLAVVGGGASLLWLHNTSVIVGTVALAVLVFLVCRRSQWNRGSLVRLSILLALIFVLWSPYLSRFVDAYRTVSTAFWAKAPTVRDMLRGVDTLFGSGQTTNLLISQLTWIGTLGLVALAGARMYVERVGGWVAAFLLGAAILPVVATIVFSLVSTPIFVIRVLIWTSIPFLIALAGVVLMFGQSWQRLVVCLVMVMPLLAGTVTQLAWDRKEPWRDAVANLSARATEKDIVLFVPYTSGLAAQYYVARHPLKARIAHVPDTPPLMGERGPDADWALRSRRVSDADLARVERLVAGHERVWMVGRTLNANRFDPERRISARLTETIGPVAHQESLAPIEIQRFDRAAR